MLNYNYFAINFCVYLEKNSEEESDNRHAAQPNQYKCPVYRNSVRAGNSNDQAKNFITTIDLNCREEPTFWILRGVCIILQSDE